MRVTTVREGILRLQGELTELLKRLDSNGALDLQTWLDESAHRRQLWAKQKRPEQDGD